jgi:predicted AlkP superfamily phosphohydrolase/phosphomutase
MKHTAKRAIVIGIDGAGMEIVLNEVKWGSMPNVARLLDRGVHKPMLGVFPTLTPPGWTALYTGSWHGTHRIMDFNIRALNRPLGETVWGINTDLSQSEYLWNTAERAGKKPLLVKVEMSWPPTVKEGIQVEGTGPGVSNRHQIAGYHLFVGGRWAPRPIGGQRDPESVDPSALQEGLPTDPTALKPIDRSKWENLPESVRPPLEAELTIRPLARGRPNMLRGKSGQPKTMFGLVYAGVGDNPDGGYNRLRVCMNRDAGNPLCELSAGQWSDWWSDNFNIDGADLKGSVRMKLITLTEDADMFELFVPQIWPVSGFTYPESIGEELYEHVGPFLQNPGRDALGLIDDETYFELLEYHHDRLANVAKYLTSTRDWDILFTETHASDYGDHFFMGQADEISGADAETIERCRSGLAKTYASIDRWIGKLLELADDDTVVVIASDHGGTPSQFTSVDVNSILSDAGLLVFKNGKDGEIDWSRTRAAYIGLVHVFINLMDREPGGIVEPSDYESVQGEIIDALMSYRDPESKRCPFILAVTREYAEVLNLWGDLVGDVVFAVHPAYDAAHGRQLPVGRFGISGQHSTFIMAGPGISKGVSLQRQVRVIDVAPTLCHLLQWPMPKNVEGGVLYEAFEDPDWNLKA